ncbi:MipA/OmpV family protein [Aestuariivita sp.]|jgi:outer membrane scaffolding protein for murein synthesis (MipA/OmpV family)|uniref:MipA/OmpV family protein n=1 Tax=Aestuariivita sp. TaxID=1872407 RepID=UPI00216EF91C|nr:MipA/OmpV family protein [Aestuariivita sp.]MCE8008186.1 MipA/OmpV family protein [Aestuariivita sp.]
MKSTHPLMAFCAAAIIVPASAFADGLLSGGEWTIGAIAGYSSGFYKGEDSELGAAPLLSYSTDRLSIGFDGVTYRAIQTDRFEAALMLAPRLSPDFPDDTPLFDGLDRDSALDAGFSLTYSSDRFYVSGSMLHDISSKHEGYEIETRIGTTVQAGRVAIDAGMGARLRDSKLSNYLVGVSKDEATADRPAYDVGRTVEPFVSVSLAMPLTERTALVGSVEYSMLDREIENSPLVRKDNTYSVGFGLIYKF